MTVNTGGAGGVVNLLAAALAPEPEVEPEPVVEIAIELERRGRAPNLKRFGLNALVLGSNASRTASENKLADNTKASMNKKAVNKFHQIIGSRDISRRAFSIIDPKEFMLGSTPMPK